MENIGSCFPFLMIFFYPQTKLKKLSLQRDTQWAGKKTGFRNRGKMFFVFFAEISTSVNLGQNSIY